MDVRKLFSVSDFKFYSADYAVCVNAATLALIDAGIPIRDVCCAVSCGLVTKNGVATTLVDLGSLFRKETILNFLQLTLKKTQKFRQLLPLECQKLVKWFISKSNRDFIWIISKK